MDNLLTYRDLSLRIGVREGTLRMWRQRGQGPRSFKIGTTVVFKLEDVQAWEAEHQEDATA